MHFTVRGVRRKEGGAGRSAAAHRGQTVQLTVPGRLPVEPRRDALREQPAVVGVQHARRRISDPVVKSVVCLEEALRGEQRHLRVVGDRAHAAKGRRRVLDARWPEAPPDGRKIVELDGGTQGVADGPSEEAAAVAVASGRPGARHRDPSDRRGGARRTQGMRLHGLSMRQGTGVIKTCIAVLVAWGCRHLTLTANQRCVMRARAPR